MHSQRWMSAAEFGCLVILFAWLIWLPMPFGSVVEEARAPLIAVPLFLCAITASIRLYATRDRSNTSQPARPWIIWSSGSVLFVLVGALQLVPLPSAMHRAVSPESYRIWSLATRIAAAADVPARAMFPMSIDPHATKVELFRIAAMIAAFTIAAALIRNHARRMALAVVLCGTAMFEALYGMREAALHRYEIWGWVNRLVFNRTTGTFVNPNHFAHYLAIVLPMALFLIAAKWHVSGSHEAPAARRFMHLIEHGIFTAGFALLAAGSCAAGILLAQSRGALLSLVAGLLAVAAMLPGRRVARLAYAFTAAALLIVALIAFLGPERTVGRFMPNEFERQTFVGRRIGISAAYHVWECFPFFGSGLGTFERVVSMEQSQDLEKIYHHAHNDYAEIGATGGTIGFVIAMVTLIGGFVTLARMTFGEHVDALSWRRRAFQAAALTSITIACVHALFDFNFFIPSNPATLSVIAGAAVAAIDHDKRTRR